MRANVASLLSAEFKLGGSENTTLHKEGGHIVRQGGQNHPYGGWMVQEEAMEKPKPYNYKETDHGKEVTLMTAKMVSTGG